MAPDLALWHSGGSRVRSDRAITIGDSLVRGTDSRFCGSKQGSRIMRASLSP